MQIKKISKAAEKDHSVGKTENSVQTVTLRQ